MTATHDPKDADRGSEAEGRALHGPRTEVNWKGGEGRQPYSNQGSEESGPPATGSANEAGDRGELSGRNLEQMRDVLRK